MTPGEITVILERIERGDAHAAGQLFPLVYSELRKLASAKMARESPGHTLQATALVHEAWLRLGGDAQPSWKNRAHFFGAAAEAMRRILIERARRRCAQRHGGEQERIDLKQLDLAGAVQADQRLLALDEALERFTQEHPRKAELVKLRYFTGLSHEEAAAALGIAVPTAKQWWAYAKAWLYQEIKP
jgi:RNA polymerase sigma factor (TIGR02999 family)